MSPYPTAVMVINANQKLCGILVNVFRSMKKLAFQYKETLSLKTVLGDSLSMYKLKSTIPEHVAPIEIFVVS